LRYFVLLLACQLIAAPLPLYFSGNEQFSDRELYEGIGLNLPYFYQFWRSDPALEPSRSGLYATTLQEFYKSRGFYHAKVHEIVNKDAIRFAISEGPDVIIDDVTVVSKLDLSNDIQSKVEERFDAATFVEDKKRILKRAYDHGHCNATLNSKAWIDREKNRAYLLFELTRGEQCRFGPIHVTTDETLAPWLAKSFLRYKENDPFSSEKIRQSYDMLYAQSGIAKANIELEEHNGSVVPTTLHVSVREDPVRFEGGAGYNSDEGFVIQGGIKHRNLFGDLRTLGLEGRYSPIRQEIKSTFTMPLPDHNLLGTILGYKNERFDGYKERSRYLKPYLQQYDQPHSYNEAILIDEAKTYDSSDEALFPENTLFVTSLQLGWKFDVRDHLLEPTRGYYLFAEVQGSKSSVISDATYIKARIGGARIFSYHDHVFGMKAHLGSIRRYEGDLPSSYRFYAGGINSNRAYTYRSLGPSNDNGDPIGFNALFEGTAEYRYAIYNELRGVVFSDVTLIGQEYLPDQNKAYTAVGVGLRYGTPIGPLGIDVGMDVENPSQYAVHFHIGELF
jgi:outer membrane translocation and assembly module TamA